MSSEVYTTFDIVVFELLHNTLSISSFVSKYLYYPNVFDYYIELFYVSPPYSSYNLYRNTNFSEFSVVALVYIYFISVIVFLILIEVYSNSSNVLP